MGRRLPWIHPHLKVDYGARTNGNSGYNNSRSRMVSRTPRGKRLMYNGGGSGSTSYGRSRYSGGYGGTDSPSSSAKKRLDGLYFEDAWWCNCTPRARAPLLQVKKKGPNTGKWFYACDTRKCNFFLWAEDAEYRAEGVTMTVPPMPDEIAATGTTPTPAAKTASAAGGPAATPSATVAASLPTPTTTQTTGPRRTFMDDYFSTQSKPSGASTEGTLGQGPRAQQAQTPSRSTKTKRVLFEFSDDEDEDKQEEDFGLGDMSSDEERAMNEAMERSVTKLRAAAPSTPVHRRTADDAQPSTPSTVTRTLFPEAKRHKAGENTAPSPSTARISSDVNTSFSTNSASSMTVAPSSSSPPASTPSKEEDLDPTEEVLALLRRPGQKVDEATTRDVTAVLRRFSMKAKGIARGRDSVRSTLRAKDEKIAALQERVASLDGRNRTQRDQIADIKASIMDLYSKH